MTADIITVLSNLSGAVATTLIFVWFLKNYLDKSIEANNVLSKTLQLLSDGIIEQNKTITELKKSIQELRDIIGKMYEHQMVQAKKIQAYEKKLKDCADKL